MNVTQLFSNQRGISDQRSEMLARPLWSPQPTRRCALSASPAPILPGRLWTKHTDKTCCLLLMPPALEATPVATQGPEGGGRPAGDRGWGQVDSLQQVRALTVANTRVGLGVQLGFKEV